MYTVRESVGKRSAHFLNTFLQVPVKPWFYERKGEKTKVVSPDFNSDDAVTQSHPELLLHTRHPPHYE
jgi:hypothetical protein